jgi:ABC transport system ATP-binding/permease protein
LAPIISAQKLSKTFGAKPLFKDISFTVSDRDRIGLIGPNGSGKSTLLAILQGRVKADSGDVAVRKGARLSYVAQVSGFAPEQTVRSVIEQALERAHIPESERQARFAETLGRAGFSDFDASASALSGGWRKRLAVAAALIEQPDILLLDEPTNHLDLAGIDWLEGFLETAPFAYVVISHDRYFLENVGSRIVELDRAYPDGFLRVDGNYSKFLEDKEEFLRAQKKQQEALANRVHEEIEWLRRGPKARTTKSKSRIGKAHEMIGQLADMNTRLRTEAADIDFSASGRQTKQLVTLDNVSYTIGGRNLIENLNFTFTSDMRVGLVGPNGSGKTTLLRLLRGDIEPASGEIRKAASLQVVYFDQNRELDPNLSLRRALAPDSDSVIYQDRVIHVAAWAARFLFTNEDLNRPVSGLSGGERARVLIAQLMLQRADLLLLDEPTNDLDIPTLEILEESLLEFRGALVLVTHDRYMLDRISTVVLGLDGLGDAQRFADYSQWETWQRGGKKKPASASTNGKSAPAVQEIKSESKPSRKKLTFAETREYETMEQRIAEVEKLLHDYSRELEDPAVAADAAKLRDACLRMEKAQKTVDRLYLRWEELEQKKA